MMDENKQSMNKKQNKQNKRSRHWSAINDFSFLAGMRLLFWVCKVFGRWPFRLLLYPVLLWYLLFKPAARRASREYLMHINRLIPTDTSIINVLRHFAAFAEMMLDKMLLWSGLFDASSVRYVGIEMMRQRLAEKRGVLLMCSHLGNLDLCRVLSRHHSELKLTVLVHTKHAQKFNQLLEKMNPASQLNLMQVTEITPATAMVLAEKVAQGEFVVIAGDRIPVAKNPRTVTANFLNVPAKFPIGPYVLASVLQCPVYMLFSLRGEDGQYEIHYELLRDAIRLPRNGRDHLVGELAADYARRLQAHCLTASLQWFNFYDFWDGSDA